jgi:hypothetical protein
MDCIALTITQFGSWFAQSGPKWQGVQFLAVVLDV